MNLFKSEPLNTIDFDIVQILTDLSCSVDVTSDSFDGSFDEIPPKQEKLIDHCVAGDYSSIIDPVISPTEPQKIELTLLDEIDQYKTMTDIQFFNEPLDFWKNSKLEKLKFLAVKVFAIPASSSEPERHNSSAGLTIDDLRNRMSPKTLECFVLYKSFL